MIVSLMGQGQYLKNISQCKKLERCYLFHVGFGLFHLRLVVV